MGNVGVEWMDRKHNVEWDAKRLETTSLFVISLIVGTVGAIWVGEIMRIIIGEAIAVSE